MNTLVYLVLVAGLVFFAGLTLVAFGWAARTGQLCRLEEGSRSIFDKDEPEGVITDIFADRRACHSRRATSSSRFTA